VPLAEMDAINFDLVLLLPPILFSLFSPIYDLYFNKKHNFPTFLAFVDYEKASTD
jgi:hypothetical protein